jgi:hypothetical protein
MIQNLENVIRLSVLAFYMNVKAHDIIYLIQVLDRVYNVTVLVSYCYTSSRQGIGHYIPISQSNNQIFHWEKMVKD